MHPDASLTAIGLFSGARLIQSLPWRHAPVLLDSPALTVMTDLTQIKAATIHPSTSLREAEQMMIFQGVRMLFVVSTMPSIEGLITSSDFHGDRSLQVVRERKVPYKELCVADVMTSLAMLDALDLEQIKLASVSNIIATLKSFGKNHLLVIQNAKDPLTCSVCGIISRSQIERQLGSPIDIAPIAKSFAEIERTLF